MELKYVFRWLAIFLTLASCAAAPPPDERLAEAEARINVLETAISQAEAARREAEQSLDEAKRNLDRQRAEELRLRQDIQEREEADALLRSDLQRAEALRDQARRKTVSLETEVASAERRLRLQNDALARAQRDYQAAGARVEALERGIAETEAARYTDGSAAITELRDRYRRAGAFFDGPPETMQVGDFEKVSLTVSLQETVEELRAKLTEQARAAGHQVRSKEILVYDVIRAYLTGTKGLLVQSLDQELDRLLTGGSQEWTWTVEAVKPGKQTLYLTLSALIRGEKGVDTIHSWEEDVEVSVSVGRATSGFLKDHWQWIWSALIVPIALFLWEMWKRRRRRGSTGKETAV